MTDKEKQIKALLEKALEEKSNIHPDYSEHTIKLAADKMMIYIEDALALLDECQGLAKKQTVHIWMGSKTACGLEKYPNEDSYIYAPEICYNKQNAGIVRANCEECWKVYKGEPESQEPANPVKTQSLPWCTKCHTYNCSEHAKPESQAPDHIPDSKEKVEPVKIDTQAIINAMQDHIDIYGNDSEIFPPITGGTVIAICKALEAAKEVTDKWHKAYTCAENYQKMYEQLQTENTKLNIILYHRENGLSHPDLQEEIDKSKLVELQAKLKEQAEESKRRWIALNIAIGYIGENDSSAIAVQGDIKQVLKGK